MAEDFETPARRFLNKLEQAVTASHDESEPEAETWKPPEALLLEAISYFELYRSRITRAINQEEPARG